MEDVGTEQGQNLGGPLARCTCCPLEAQSPHCHWPHGHSHLETRREACADEPALLFGDIIPHCAYNREMGKLTARLAFRPHGFIPSSDVSQT